MRTTTRVLVVDDHVAIRQWLCAQLREERWELWEAGFAWEGLQVVRTHHPDLVLLNVRLPDLDGIEVCRQIKTDTSLSDISVVLFSDVATAAELEMHVLEAGADDYFVYPPASQEFLTRMRDIVHLRETNIGLRRSEQDYRRLMEVQPDAVVLTDLHGQLRLVNPQALAMLGYGDARELLRRSVFDLTSAEDHERLRMDFEITRLQGRIREAEYVLIRKDGTSVPVELNATAFTELAGVPAGLILVARDATARQQAEGQIRLLADAMQSAQDLICITDQENRFTYANRAFLEAYGYTEAEILGRTPEMLYAAANPPGLYSHVFEKTLAGGWRGEVVHRRKDGTEFPISLGTSLIKTPTGTILGLVGVAQDISERKRAEKRRTAFSHLEHRLSSALTPEDAAKIILEIADEFFGWDAADVHLYSKATDKVIPVLKMDTVDGQHIPLPAEGSTLEPTPVMRLVMERGAQLVNGSDEAGAGVELVLFGGARRHPAARMYVPVLVRGTLLGILSIQSYTPQLYAREDLSLLQALADHCGETLDRIKGREELRQAVQKYRSIFENAPHGIFQTTPEGCFRSANPALARILGYATPEELITSTADLGWQLYSVPEQRAEFRWLLETQGFVQEFEAELYRKDGSRIWASLNAHVVRDAAGTLLYHEGTARDITERKWTANLLQLQGDYGVFLSSTSDLGAVVQRLLKLILQFQGANVCGVYLVDANSGALDLVAQHGLSSVFTERASHLSPDSDPAPASRITRAVLREAAWPMAVMVDQLKRENLRAKEIIPIQYGGQVVAVVIFGSHLFDEIPARSRRAIEMIAGQAGGAIARIRAEQMLSTHRQLMEKTLHGLPAAVFILDARTYTIGECNPAATRIFGYKREEILGRKLSLLHVDQADYEEFCVAIPGAVQDTGGYLKEFEFDLKRKDGMVIPTIHNLMPINDETGRTVFWVSVVRDIREQKRAEEELRQVSRRIIEAQEAERQRVARELHDGVNQVIASAKLRLRSVDDQLNTLSPATREILARCSQLLVEALEENRRIAYNLRPSDLDELGLAAACRNFCRTVQSRSGLTVHSRIARMTQRFAPEVELNLFRILQEAANNIEKHARARTVRVRLALAKDSLVLKIQDDGRGFDPATARTRKRQGAGIGLTNIRERAASLGGTSEVRSTLKQGTAITVRVPVKRTYVTAERQAPAPSGPPSTQHTA